MEHNPRTPEDEVVRAGQAREVLENPMFREAVAFIEEGLKSQRRAIPLRETEMHTKLIVTEQLWENLKDWLEQTAQTGQLAQLQIAEKKRFAMFRR